jgi:2'-hydroxyisoflavone reductase
MRILFLGGTQFVGRHMVAAALARGHTVTLFNRGQTNPELFPKAEKLRGDRDGGLDALKGRAWDTVIDVNGYVPRLVRDSAELLRDTVEHYIFVSTGSVYDFSQLKGHDDESAPLETLEDETTEEYAGPAYGGLKVLCERVVEDVFAGRGLSLRLGVVAGPHDPTDRVTYWVTRVARGGQVLAPGAPDRPIQFIDARDLADFTMIAAEKRLAGIYNTIGRSVTWQEWLDACQTASSSDATYTWIDDEDFVRDNIDVRARPYGVIPMAVPANLAHLFTMRSVRAEAAGLTYRPLVETARDILAWDRTRPADEERQAGLTSEQEQTLLQKWHARQHGR